MKTLIINKNLFQILSIDKTTEVGLIAKHWSGFTREAFTEDNNFGITFPMNLDVRMKAVMIGACFLIVSEMYTKYIIYSPQK